MAESMTFGVELEFALACLAPYDVSPDITEERIVHFDVADIRYMQEFARVNTLSINAKRRDVCMHTSQRFLLFIMKNIEITLMNAGYPVQPTMGSEFAISLGANEGHEPDKWHVKTDWSIMGPAKDCSESGKEIGSGYRYVAIEVVSPVFGFSEESLKTVADVCHLLNTTYLLNTNDSTGLHVHVGNGDRGYTFDNLKKIAAFLWLFTPQLNMLHSPARQTIIHSGDSSQCSMRDRSVFVSQWMRHFKVPPKAHEGVFAFFQSRDRADLLKLLQNYASARLMAYNFGGLREHNGKPTIEFRQHDGTMDGTAATMWIKTVVGIVEACQRCSMEFMHDFLKDTAKMEKWERRYDGKDDERVAKRGLPLAEKEFTVIMLLRRFGINEPATYYEGRGLFYHYAPQTHRDVYGCDADPSDSDSGSDQDTIRGLTKTKEDEAREREMQEEKELMNALTNHNEGDPIYWEFNRDTEL